MILYEKGSTTTNASGTTFTLQDTSNERKLSFKKYYGDTQQSGTPTPSSPQPINVVTGDNVVSVTSKQLFDKSKSFIYSNIANNQWTITELDTGLRIKTSRTSGYPVVFYNVCNLTNYVGKKVRLKCNFNVNGNRSASYGIALMNNYGTSRTTIETSSTSGHTITYTIPTLSDKEYLGIYFYMTATTGATTDDYIDYTDIIVTIDNEDMSYEDFGKNYSINLPTENLLQTTSLSSNPLVLTGGLTITKNDDGTYTLNGEKTTSGVYYLRIGDNFTLEAGTYTLSNSNELVSNSGAIFYDDGGSFSQLNIDTKTFTETKTIKPYIKIQPNVEFDNLTIKPMIARGTTKTYYPYGTTPIELNKINTYQDTIFKSSGINIWNIQNQQLNLLSYDSSTGVYSASDNDNRSSLIYKLQQYNGDSAISGTTTSVTISATGKYVLTTTIVENCNRLRLANNGQSYEFSLFINDIESLGINVGDTITLGFNVIDTTIGASKFKDLMLLKGTYTSQNLPNYEPYGTDYYIKKEIGKVVLDENTEIGGIGYELTNSYRFYTGAFIDCVNGISISNYFKNDTINNINTIDSPALTTINKAQIILRIDKSIASSIPALKTWLSSNNVSVYYVLNIPTYTKVTGELLEQIEALENATTYDNVTNILQSNTDLPLYIDLEYLKPLDFSRNGLGYLPNPISAYVTDEINGEYSLTFEYPIQDAMANEIVEDRIVKCKVADGTNQCFVIKKIQKNFDKMSVYCTHLFYMLYDDFLEDTYPQNLSPKPFLDHILSRANYQLPFVANSDIATSKSARYVRKNVVEAILGDIDNSMYNLWGMELKRDNWNIGLKARLGVDKGEKLIFGKNITGVDVNIDTTGIYTRIMPIGFDGLLLPEKYVDAPNINAYPYPRICLYEFPNIRYDANLEDTEAYHTLDEAYQALRDATQELFDKGINLPNINIQVDWLELSKTEEFKQYSALERVDLGDTLTSNLFGMDYETRVIKTIYNPLNDRIEQFEIGTARPSITSEMNQLDFDIVNLPQSMLDEAQANATQLITQAMGGYVYKTNSELYIMDNPDPAQAVKVWRWNINGLGYSSTGINGTYGIAMTMDGSIVADFITTGQLSANVISANTVLSILANNEINLTSKNITINSTNFSVDSGGNMTCSNATITGGDVTLVDDGLSETVSKVKISGRDNVVTNELFSYGMEINNTNGKKIEIGTSTTDHFNAQKIISGNAKEVFEITDDGAIISQYYDTNNNVTRWSTLFPGTDNDSAFTLGTGSSTNFEIHNEQNNTYAKIKGVLVATDSNDNQTFVVDGATGNVTCNTINGNLPDSGWLTLLSGSSDGNSIHYRKIGKQVIITGVYYSSSGVDIASWTATTINTLSSEYRPSKNIAGSVIAKNSSNVMLDIGIRVDASGNVDLVPYVGDAMNVSTMYVNLSYFVD